MYSGLTFLTDVDIETIEKDIEKAGGEIMKEEETFWFYRIYVYVPDAWRKTFRHHFHSLKSSKYMV